MKFLYVISDAWFAIRRGIIFQWLKWRPRGKLLLAGAQDSTIWLWQCRNKVRSNSYLTILFYQYHRGTSCKYSRAMNHRYRLVGSRLTGNGLSAQTQLETLFSGIPGRLVQLGS